MRLKLAARKSDLARLQAHLVGAALQAQDPSLQVEYRFRESLGDKNLTDPLWQAPEKGVFTEDFHRDLVEGAADLVVHSWKDLPVAEKPETLVAACLERADSRDLLLFKRSARARVAHSGRLEALSSSPRRSLNLKDFAERYFPFAVRETRFTPVRGNIQTRVRKLIESGEADALIVAKAAFDRLLAAEGEEFAEGRAFLAKALAELDWMVLPLSLNPTAAAQGALAVEARRDRADILALLKGINHAPSFEAVQRERAILASHGGGCHQAIGVSVQVKPYGTLLRLRGKTDAGLVLDQRGLEPAGGPSLRGLKGLDVARDFFMAQRQPLELKLAPGQWQGLLVAKEDAWPEHLHFAGLVWASGLKTWQKLARRGVWVNGTQDGLGEDEPLGLEQLAPRARFAKLSHADAGSTRLPLLASYQVILTPREPSESLLGYDCFFWSSGSGFERALALQPGILAKRHACGPGNTAATIRRILQERGIDAASALSIFLTPSDWEAACRP
jgi:hydroxymethylbilane synthase